MCVQPCPVRTHRERVPDNLASTGSVRGVHVRVCPEANRRPSPTPWSFLTFFSSCLSTSAPPGGAWRADFKSIYGRNFGDRLLTQIVLLLL
jgi:hypothetical protein